MDIIHKQEPGLQYQLVRHLAHIGSGSRTGHRATWSPEQTTTTTGHPSGIPPAPPRHHPGITACGNGPRVDTPKHLVMHTNALQIQTNTHSSAFLLAGPSCELPPPILAHRCTAQRLSTSAPYAPTCRLSDCTCLPSNTGSRRLNSGSPSSESPVAVFSFCSR